MTEFVDYNIAKQLKEIGFDEECLGCFDEQRVFGFTIRSIQKYYKNSKEDTYSIAVPTYYQVFQWFRTKHKLHSTITWTSTGYDYYIKVEPTRIINVTHIHSEYRDAEIACIEYMIKLIKDGSDN